MRTRQQKIQHNKNSEIAGERKGEQDGRQQVGAIKKCRKRVCNLGVGNVHASFASENAAEQQRVSDASGGVCLVELLPCRCEVDVFEIPW